MDQESKEKDRKAELVNHLKPKGRYLNHII